MQLKLQDPKIVTFIASPACYFPLCPSQLIKVCVRVL